MNKLIELNNLSKRYYDQLVLENINYCFPSKGIVGILGCSGSGKSTLLNIVSGLEKEYSGFCKVLGKEMSTAKSEFRLKNIGYVFQNFSLFEVDTVLNNVLVCLDATSNDSYKFKIKKCKDLINFVGLKKKINQKVNTLSGGEKQRVCLARALATSPKILLCDEPTGSLDESNANIVFDLLKKVSTNILVVIASHDRDLTYQYADEIIKVSQKTIVIEKSESSRNDIQSFTEINLKRKKRKCLLSNRFLFSHSFNVFKAKKWRTSICCCAISVGLIGLGLSTYVSNCISDEVETVFDSIVPSNQIVMSTYNQITNPLEHIYSAPMTALESLKSEYEAEIKDFGINYIVDFESFFKDSNLMYALKSKSMIVLPSFSARSCNDFLWLDDYLDRQFFPSKNFDLDNDSIVLGLPYTEMINLCFGLQILRNYESLGYYIHNHGLQIYFSFANYDWLYEDEQVFNVKAIIPFDSPTIFHTNHRWNEYLFEERMRFPVNDYEDTSLPWIMNKVFYFETFGEISSLIKNIRSNEKYNSYLFEPPSYQYESSHCSYGEVCNLKRVYVYQADKNTIPYQDILKVTKLDEISSKIITTSGSYFAYPSSMMIGFGQLFFVTASEESCDLLVDTYSHTKIGDENNSFLLPKDCSDGNYLKTAMGGIKLSSDFPQEIEGRLPVGLEEVLVSSSLKEKWNLGSEIFVVAQIGENKIDEYIQRDIRVTKLKITGVVNELTDTLYVNDDWTIDFFRDYLGMSCFYLEPTGAVLTIKDGYDPDIVLSKLSKSFPKYSFSNPSKTVSESLSSTTDYIGVVLSGASFISLSISILLFFTVIVISITENEPESIIFYKIGISRKDICKIFRIESLSYLVISGILSSLIILFMEVITQKYIGSMFNVSVNRINLNFEPILLMTLFIFFSFCIVSVAIFAHFKKKFKNY